MQKTILSVAIAALIPTLSTAQENSDTLDTILVDSVYAVPAERDNTGSAVTILSEKDFQARNATYVIDALRTLPSISIAANGGRGTTTSVFLRGAESNQTLVVIDGVKSNPATGYGFDFGKLPLENIERIEVLRGEQSALWGSDAIGGVINITTKSGKYAEKPFNAYVRIGGGSNKTANVSATLFGRQDDLYYAIHAAHDRTDGISAAAKHQLTYTDEQGAKQVTGGATEKDRFKRHTISAKVGYEFANAGIEALLQHQQSVGHSDGKSSRRALGTTFDTTSETLGNPRTKSQKNTIKLSGYLGSHNDAIRQSAYLANTHSKNNFYYWNAFAMTAPAAEVSSNKGKQFNAGYQIDINFDRDGSVTQALSGLLDYQKTTFDSSSFQGKNKGEKTISDTHLALEYRLFSEDDHALSIGVRHDNNSLYKNNVTYRIAGGYRLTDNFRLHSSFGTGVKNPSIYEYYGFSGNYLANPNLKPEKSIGGDLGLLIESSDKSHQVDVTYFNRRTKDRIASVTSGLWPNSVTQAINETGTARAKGLEIAYKGEINEALSAYANYTYTDSTDDQGKPLIRIAKNQANLGINYTINKQFSANASLNYTGKREDQYGWGKTATRVKMPSYTVMNLGASYQLNKNLATYLNINNVFNKKYETVLGYGQPERSFYLGLKGSW